MDDRRRAVRLEKTLEAVLYLDGKVRIFVTDLSVTGLRGYTRSELSVDETIQLKLNLGELVEDEFGDLQRTGEPVTLSGRVVWQRPGGSVKNSLSIGCEFIELEDETRAKLDDFVTAKLAEGHEEGSVADDTP